MTKSELEKLLTEHGHSLSAFCYTISGNRDAAMEIFQEVCLRLMGKNVRIENGAAAKAYLYRAALNVYRDFCRKKGRRELPAADADLAREYVGTVGVGDDEREEYAALYLAIAKLPLKYREVIRLVYFRNVTESEAAGILGIPLGTVKSRLHKAKELLKELLQK